MVEAMCTGAIPSRIARELLGFSKEALERWAARGEPAVASSGAVTGDWLIQGMQCGLP